MLRRIILCLALLNVACGKKPTVDDENTVNDVTAVKTQRLLYLGLTERLSLDKFTFVVSPNAHCDSLLFTSLFLASGGQGVDIMKAKDDSGLWERHPARDCASTISKDMFIGLFTWLWQSKNLGEVRSLIHVGESRNWVMGEGPAGQVVMTPNLIATLYEIRYRLGGEGGLGRSLYNEAFEAKGLSGFEAHLQVLHILLRGSLVGKITDLQAARLKEHAERQPRNVLFQAAHHRYVDGNQETALALFPVYCPAGRLPTTADRCDDYLWQRDENPGDWAACSKAPAKEWTFSGVDCEVSAAVIEGML